MLTAESEGELNNSILTELDSVLFDKQVIKPTQQLMLQQWKKTQQDLGKELDSFLNLERQIEDEARKAAVDSEEKPKAEHSFVDTNDEAERLSADYELNSGVLNICELESFLVQTSVLPLADDESSDWNHKLDTQVSIAESDCKVAGQHQSSSPCEATEAAVDFLSEFTIKNDQTSDCPKIVQTPSDLSFTNTADAHGACAQPTVKVPKSSLVAELFPGPARAPAAEIDSKLRLECETLKSKNADLSSKVEQLMKDLAQAERDRKAMMGRLRRETTRHSSEITAQTEQLEKERRQLVEWRQMTEKAFKRERALWEKSKKAAEILPTKHERLEIEQLKAELVEQKAELERKESRWILERDRLRHMSEQSNMKNRELLDEIRVMERDRAAKIQMKHSEPPFQKASMTVSVGVQCHPEDLESKLRVFSSCVEHPLLAQPLNTPTSQVYFTNGDFYVVPSAVIAQVYEIAATSRVGDLLKRFGGMFYFADSMVFQSYLAETRAYLFEYPHLKQTEYHFLSGEKFMIFPDGVKVSVFPPPSPPSGEEREKLVNGLLPSKTWTEQLVEFPDGSTQLLKCTLVDPMEGLVKREKIFKAAEPVV